MEAQSRSPYMTRNEVADYFRCSTDTVDRMCRDKKITAVSAVIGSMRRILILRSSVYAILPPELPEQND